ncbi:hypothetical protein WI36_20280 [Burkholderia ubonensis]|nr:hypothetical protein WI36_20280 [Burkholderia ubonensis]
MVFHLRLLERIVERVTGEVGDGAARIAESASGVPLVYRRTGLPSDEFLALLAEELEQRWGSDSDEALLIPALLQRVAPLLEIDALAVSAQAITMAVDLPNSFAEAGFAVDLRPIFYTDDDEAKGVMLLTTLRLSYAVGSDTKEISLSLDEVDLDALSEAVQAVKQQVASSKQLIKQLGVPFVPVTAGRRE